MILPRIILPFLHFATVWLCCTVVTAITLPAATFHVWQDSPAPVAPYANWTTAAHTIQDAVDAAQSADTVLVTNGIYATGGRAVTGTMTNRVAIDKAITVQSVNGPEATLIVGAAAFGGTNGNGAIRCVYLGYNALLIGFTLTHGHTLSDSYGANQDSVSGGAAWSEASGVVSNCVLTGNSASVYGGGVFGGVLRDCMLNGNSAMFGGGAHETTLSHCLLSSNSAAASGGGVYLGFVSNCDMLWRKPARASTRRKAVRPY